MLTKPFLLNGRKLFVNVDAIPLNKGGRGLSFNGELSVEVLDEHGAVLATSNPVTGDLPRGEVDWQQGNFSDFKGKVVSLRFTLSNAKFYSYWLE